MKKGLACLITAAAFAFTGFCLPVEKVGAEKTKDIEKSIEWALAIAEDDTHGYSQSSRWGPDYDCSSFVIQALREGGFKTGFAITTKNMRKELEYMGFTWVDWSEIGDESGLQRGDVLMASHHTEIYLGNGRKVGAHSAGKYFDENGDPVTGDQDGNEISENDYKYASWNGVLRYIPKPFEDLEPANIGETKYAMLSFDGKYLHNDGTFGKADSHDKLFFKLSKTGSDTYIAENMQGELLTVTGDEDICFCEALTDSETQSFYICPAKGGHCIRPVSVQDKALTHSGDGIILNTEQEELSGQVFDLKLFDAYPEEHLWGEWKVLREADTGTEGLREHTCGICGQTEQETIPALPEPEPEPEPEFIPGDTDGSGEVDIIDAVMIISHINGIRPLTDEQLMRADIDGEEGISITDAVTVIGYINGTVAVK